MIKKILLSTIAISSIIIAWCGDKKSFEFNFDDFHGSFFTNNVFSINKAETKWLAAWLLENNIIVTYTQKQSSWYTDSIIIIKKPSSQSLEEFVSQNTKKIKLNWYTSQSTDENKIKCNDEKIDIQTIDSNLEWNLSTTFFSQTFFMHKDKAYIVSFSSEEKQERDIFSDNVKDIKCIEKN